MRDFSYPVVLTEDDTEGGFVVSFPDLQETITQGDDAAEAGCEGGVRLRAVQASGFLHPRRDIPPAMEDTPDVYVILAFDVEDEIREALQRPAAQPWDVQLARVTGRSGGRLSTDVRVRPLESIDESQRGLPCALVEVVRDRLVHVPVGQDTRNDGLDLHGRTRRRTRSRRASK